MGNTFSAEFLGMSNLKLALEKLGANANLAAREAVTQAAAIVEAVVKGEFQGAHAAGAPHTGNSRPNIVSGRLRASVHADPVNQSGEKDSWGTFVGPRMIYGRRVELGYNGSHPYPYAGPGFRKAKPLIAAAQSDVIRKFLSRG